MRLLCSFWCLYWYRSKLLSSGYGGMDTLSVEMDVGTVVWVDADVDAGM